MAYSQKTKEAAFKIFAVCESYEETARQMRQRYPADCARMRRQTIKKWYSRLGWRERLEKIKAEIAQATNAEIVSERQKMLGDLRQIYDRLVLELKNDDLQPRSLEGGINSLNTIISKIQELSGTKTTGTVQIEQMITVIFQALSEDEKAAQLLAGRQEILLQHIREKLAQIEEQK